MLFYKTRPLATLVGSAICTSCTLFGLQQKSAESKQGSQKGFIKDSLREVILSWYGKKYEIHFHAENSLHRFLVAPETETIQKSNGTFLQRAGENIFETRLGCF